MLLGEDDRKNGEQLVSIQFTNANVGIISL